MLHRDKSALIDLILWIISLLDRKNCNGVKCDSSIRSINLIFFHSDAFINSFKFLFISNDSYRRNVYNTTISHGLFSAAECSIALSSRVMRTFSEPDAAEDCNFTSAT